MACIPGAYFCVHLSSLKICTTLQQLCRQQASALQPRQHQSQQVSQMQPQLYIRLTSICGRHTEDKHTLCSPVNALLQHYLEMTGIWKQAMFMHSAHSVMIGAPKVATMTVAPKRQYREACSTYSKQVVPRQFVALCPNENDLCNSIHDRKE